MVDLPDAERPVSHTVRPCWRRREERIVGVRGLGWKVMLLYMMWSVLSVREGRKRPSWSLNEFDAGRTGVGKHYVVQIVTAPGLAEFE